MTRRRRETRTLASLVSVGPATLRDFELLGIRSVPDLARADPRRLYERLCEVTQTRHDPCAEDVFAAAVAQARDPSLPAEKCAWWYWSRLRKARESDARRIWRPDWQRRKGRARFGVQNWQ